MHSLSVCSKRNCDTVDILILLGERKTREPRVRGKSGGSQGGREHEQENCKASYTFAHCQITVLGTRRCVLPWDPKPSGFSCHFIPTSLQRWSKFISCIKIHPVLLGYLISPLWHRWLLRKSDSMPVEWPHLKVDWRAAMAPRTAML